MWNLLFYSMPVFTIAPFVDNLGALKHTKIVFLGKKNKYIKSFWEILLFIRKKDRSV